jgi:hypothetical protein
MELAELETLIREQADSIAMHATAIAEGKIPRDNDGGALRLVAKARQIHDLSVTLQAWAEFYQALVADTVVVGRTVITRG